MINAILKGCWWRIFEVLILVKELKWKILFTIWQSVCINVIGQRSIIKIKQLKWIRPYLTWIGIERPFGTVETFALKIYFPIWLRKAMVDRPVGTGDRPSTRPVVVERRPTIKWMVVLVRVWLAVLVLRSGALGHGQIYAFLFQTL